AGASLFTVGHVWREAFGVLPACPAPYPYLQCQRDCVTQPRVARNELPWVKVTDNSQPQRGCGMVVFPWSSATTLSGLSLMSGAFSQGSSFLATLGFVAESLWDSALGATRSKIRVKEQRQAGTFAV